jgi:DNA-binding LacI/PurR family transcriptional regulator
MKTRVTSQQVAERAGVSRSTVSFILNNVPGMKFTQDTKDRVVEAAKELGYVPDDAARTLASGQTQTLGLVICHAEHLKVDAFISHVLFSLNEISRQYGFRLITESVEDVTQPDAYAGLVHAKKIDGLVVVNPRSDDSQLPKLIEQDFPIVLIGSIKHPLEYSINHVGSARKAAEHLVSLGHKRIAHVTFAPPDNYTGASSRLVGFRRVLENASIPFSDSLLAYGNYSAESGFTAMQSLLKTKPYPTAVFCGNDTIAVGAIAAIHNKGLRIPEDIALVGIDDIPMAAYTTPPLTTVNTHALEQGRLAGEMLISLIKGEVPKEQQVRLETQLVIRESCGAKMLHVSK